MNSQVSIIIPVYNGERYLEECLSSIEHQTHPDMQVIIVNDGSTDGSEEIANSFCRRDARFELINIANSGVSKARNVGIEKARGKYITFVDADDCLQPVAMERMIGLLEKRNAKVCICGFSKGEEFKAEEIAERRPEEYSYAKAMKRALYQSRIMNSAWGSVFETSLLRPRVRFREGIRYEDLDAFYRFYEKADKILFINEALYFYREHKSSFTQLWSIERLDVLDVTDRMVEYFQERYPQLRRAASDRRFSAHFNILMLLLRNNITDKFALRRCYNVIKENRFKAILDPHVRLKNKLGAILSFGGIRAIRRMAKSPAVYHSTNT